MGKRLFTNNTKSKRGPSNGQKNVTSTLDHVKECELGYKGPVK